MRVAHLELADFRCFTTVALDLGPGLTVFFGANGEGKTSLLEAVAWAARGRSFRSVPDKALVRTGRASAIVRAEVTEGERRQGLEAEINASGRNRLLLNRQPLRRTRDLVGFLRVTVFAPDDLLLVKGGPAERRDYLDDLLASLAPRYEAARGDLDRVLRQRNALLRSGIRGTDDEHTLEVFDEQLVRAGAELVRGRLRLLAELAAPIAEAYARLAGRAEPVSTAYEAEWSPVPLDPGAAPAVDGLLREALVAHRRQELDRGVTLVGPHRDDWALGIAGLDARTQASQGEQRSLALALRLAGHELSARLSGTAPVLLLDDVFSELDPQRADALVRLLPAGQTLLTTASGVPDGVAPERRLRVANGTVSET